MQKGIPKVHKWNQKQPSVYKKEKVDTMLSRIGPPEKYTAFLSGSSSCGNIRKQVYFKYFQEVTQITKLTSDKVRLFLSPFQLWNPTHSSDVVHINFQYDLEF